MSPDHRVDGLAARIRPYARTGGRTRGNRDLALETIVRTTPQGRAAQPRLERDHARIVELCAEPLSVAELMRTHFERVDAAISVAAFVDGYPVTEGHLLIGPLRHSADFFSMWVLYSRDTVTVVDIVAENMKAADSAITGFNIGMNIGASAGQTVFHAHLHVIPRRGGDTDNPKGGVRGVIDGKRAY